MMIWNLLLVCFVFGPSPGVLAMSEEKMSSALYSTFTMSCKFSFLEGFSDWSLIWEKEQNERRVILYKLLNGQENLEGQDPRYRGRVGLSPEGNLDLTLRNVTHDDEGTYYCRVANRKVHKEKKVTLSIDRLDAKDPTVTLHTIDGKRRMKCMSSGVYHVPRISWITARGEDLSTYGSINITETSNGWKLVESALDYELEPNVQVLCHIHEGRLKRSTRAVKSDGKHSVSVEDIKQEENV